MRRAQLVAEAVAVLCPFCEEAQPNKDGSEMWTAEDFQKTSGQLKCVACEARFVVTGDTKVRLQ